MRYMGIDYGTKRVGVAFSDEGGTMAFPHSVVANDKQLVPILTALAQKEGVGAIVFGKSHTLGGEDNPVAEDAGACARTLGDALKVSVHFESEVFTTQEAIREQGRNEMTDAAAATIILNSYLARIKHAAHTAAHTMISYDDFAKLEVRLGKVLEVEVVEGADKLLRLSVDVGEGAPRQIVSGIRLYFPEPQLLVGRTFPFLTNLEPRVIRGIESQGMILAASTMEGDFGLLEPTTALPPGTRIK